MAYTFPLSLADFFEEIPIQTVNLTLGEAMEHNQTASGEVTTASLGSRLWQATITTNPDYHIPAMQLEAKLDMLREAGASLFVGALPIDAPQYDPTGAILGSSAVTLADVRANNKEVTLAGLPSGYELRPGDLFSFNYGSNPVRTAMHRVVRGGTAADVFGPQLRGNGAPDLVGAATAATYNTGTGAGQATRVNATNQSTVAFQSLALATVYEVTIQNTGAANVVVRDLAAGDIFGTILPGQTSTIRFNTGTRNSMRIASSGAATVNFTVVSFRQVTPGRIVDIEVRPHIRLGYVTGLAVTLIKPRFKAKYVPGSASFSASGNVITGGLSFTVVQTLR